jgi:hypothetical protein
MHNRHADYIIHAVPLSGSELYEVLIAAFPEWLNSTDEEEDYRKVRDFADDLVRRMDEKRLRELLGRIVLLTLPVKTALLGYSVHALGSLEIVSDGSFIMTTSVQRPALEIENKRTMARSSSKSLYIDDQCFVITDDLSAKARHYLELPSDFELVEATRILQHDTGNGVVQIPLPDGQVVAAFQNPHGKRRYGVIKLNEPVS